MQHGSNHMNRDPDARNLCSYYWLLIHAPISFEFNLNSNGNIKVKMLRGSFS